MDVEICWFCEQQPASPDRELNVELSKRVNQDWTGVQRTFTGVREAALIFPASVRIPRCAACADCHQKIQVVTWVVAVPLAFVAAVSAFIFGSRLFLDSDGFIAILGLLVSLVCIWLLFFNIGSLVGRKVGEKLFLHGRRSQESVARYIPVLELLAQGYTLGRTRSKKPLFFL